MGELLQTSRGFAICLEVSNWSKFLVQSVFLLTALDLGLTVLKERFACMLFVTIPVQGPVHVA